MAKLFGLAGTGGFAREVMPFAASAVASDPAMEGAEIVFIGRGDEGFSELNGYRVMGEEAFLNGQADLFFNVAVGEPNLRKKISGQLERRATPYTLKDKDARLVGENRIAEGAVLCPFSVVTSDAVIGKFFHANLYAYVAHDCVIGDYVTFAPGVKCNGNVAIGHGVYVGTGAIIRNGQPGEPLTIGDNAVIGMGAVVTQSVRAGVVVIGNPAIEKGQR